MHLVFNIPMSLAVKLYIYSLRLPAISQEHSIYWLFNQRENTDAIHSRPWCRERFNAFFYSLLKLHPLMHVTQNLNEPEGRRGWHAKKHTQFNLAHSDFELDCCEVKSGSGLWTKLRPNYRRLTNYEVKLCLICASLCCSYVLICCCS